MNLYKVLMLIIFICTSTVLCISVFLDAHPTGVGTHQQLGLKPCGFLVMTHYPCPMCGMTTTFSLMTHGKILEAIVNQPFGVFLYIGNVFVLICSFLDLFFKGRRIAKLRKYILQNRSLLGILFAFGLIGAWFYKISVFGQHQ